MPTDLPQKFPMFNDLTSIVKYNPLIFNPSTASFVEELAAYITVDIDQNQITSIDDWCPQPK